MNPYHEILKENWKIIMETIMATILSALFMVFAGFSLSFFFTAYEQETHKIKALILTFLIELLIWLGAMGMYDLSLTAKCHAKRVIRHDIRMYVSKKINSMSYQEQQTMDSGNLVSWLTNDVDQTYTQAFAPVFSMTEALASGVFSLAALFFLSPYIGITAMILLGIVSVLPHLVGKKLQKASAQRSEAMALVMERYKDTVMGCSIFLLSNLRSQFTKRIAEASQEAEHKDYRFNRMNIHIQIMITTFSMAGQVILLCISFLAAAIGLAVPGAVLSVANLSGSFFNGVGDFTQAITQMKASKSLWDKFIPKDTVAPVNRKTLRNLKNIRMNGISFRYGQIPVMENADYEFRENEKYALIGESGSGKSTLVKILLGLLPDYSGHVFYDEMDQKEISLESLYDQISYVDQQVYLFQDTLRYNITLGQPYSDEDIAQILRQCGLTELVASLPQGVDTIISENGKNLSGGQRQRIALARSLIRKVRWIILDEGTSALDEENAVQIESNLVKQKHLGVIFITHHLRENMKPFLAKVYNVIKM